MVRAQLRNLPKQTLDEIKAANAKIKNAGQGARKPGSIIGSSRSQEWFENIAKSATKNPHSDKLVLGHFAKDGISYQKVAAHYKATYFKVDNWDKVAKGLSQDEIWKINETFLIQQLKQGKQVLFSHNPLKVQAGSFFEKEVNFMKELGYTFKKKNQWIWEAIK